MSGLMFTRTQGRDCRGGSRGRLEDYVQVVEAAQARRDRLTAQITAMLPNWTLAPVVAAPQAMRGMALVDG
jgi:hypothetical protein